MSSARNDHPQPREQLPGEQEAMGHARPERLRRRDAPYYVPPPAPEPGKPPASSRWRAVALGVAAAGVLGVGIWSALQPVSVPRGDAPARVETGQQQTTLLVSEADKDDQATTRLRMHLSGSVPAKTDRSDPSSLAAANAKALNELDAGNSPLAQLLRSGQRSLYRLRLLDFLQQDGDEVELQVDGGPIGTIPLSNAGTEILIPLAPGTRSRVRVVATRDGGGGVTLGMVSSLGDVRTRVLHVGESEEWSVQVQ